MRTADYEPKLTAPSVERLPINFHRCTEIRTQHTLHSCTLIQLSSSSMAPGQSNAETCSQADRRFQAQERELMLG